MSTKYVSWPSIIKIVICGCLAKASRSIILKSVKWNISLDLIGNYMNMPSLNLSQNILFTFCDFIGVKDILIFIHFKY